MRHLLQTRVLMRSTLAALVSALAAYPRFLLWPDRKIPIWFLEAGLFICAIVLWAFVFAWHRVYAQRPIFWVKWDLKIFSLVTLAGLISAAVWHRWLDPALKQAMSAEFPDNWQQWLAGTIFSLGFSQLFLTFAPFDWWLRLCRHRKASVVLTALVGVSMVALKLDARQISLSMELWAILLAVKFIGGLLLAIFYLRGGMALACWWALLIETRHLPDFF